MMLLVSLNGIELRSMVIKDGIIILMKDHKRRISLPINPNELDILIKNLQLQLKEIKKQ